MLVVTDDSPVAVAFAVTGTAVATAVAAALVAVVVVSVVSARIFDRTGWLEMNSWKRIRLYRNSWSRLLSYWILQACNFDVLRCLSADLMPGDLLCDQELY